MIKAALFRGLANRQFLFIKHPNDFSRQLGFKLFNVGILITKVPKNVVMTNRTSASCYCMVNKDGNVTKLKVEHHKKLKKKTSSNNKFDGFYFDRYTKKWRTDDGEVCHSCTPENGFPKHP